MLERGLLESSAEMAMLIENANVGKLGEEIGTRDREYGIQTKEITTGDDGTMGRISLNVCLRRTDLGISSPLYLE